MKETDDHLEKTARKSASWVYRKKEGVGFWTSLVLTGKNYSDNNLGVDRETADAIFSLFVEKGFFFFF